MEIPTTYVKNGALTDDGLAAKAFIENIFAEADEGNDLLTLNSMGGYASHYYVNVFKGGGKGFGMTPEAWFEEFKPGADNAFRAMEYLKEQAAKEDDQQEKVDGIEATLGQVKKDLLQEVRVLKAQSTKQLARIKALEADADADAEADEEETEDDTDADADTDAGDQDEEKTED
jgi:hypothetical protein